MSRTSQQTTGNSATSAALPAEGSVVNGHRQVHDLSDPGHILRILLFSA
jgi:hypothetical protein